MKSVLLYLLLLALTAGCGRGLEKTSSLLKAGMNEDQVKQVFKGFPIVATNEVGVLRSEENINHLETHGDIDSKIQLFSTNKAYVFTLGFSPTSFGDWDRCWVYFDTNGIIVGYHYMAIR